jgi:hypothetical protein
MSWNVLKVESIRMVAMHPELTSKQKDDPLILSEKNSLALDVIPTKVYVPGF